MSSNWGWKSGSSGAERQLVEDSTKSNAIDSEGTQTIRIPLAIFRGGQQIGLDELKEGFMFCACEWTAAQSGQFVHGCHKHPMQHVTIRPSELQHQRHELRHT
jgi:hypothetical protein